MAVVLMLFKRLQTKLKHTDISKNFAGSEVPFVTERKVR
jgi:hypothetical protein